MNTHHNTRDMSFALLSHLGYDEQITPSALANALASINGTQQAAVVFTLQSILQKLNEQNTLTKRLHQENQDIINALTQIIPPKPHRNTGESSDDRKLRKHRLQTSKIINTSTLSRPHSDRIERVKFDSNTSRRFSMDSMKIVHQRREHTPKESYSSPVSPTSPKSPFARFAKMKENVWGPTYTTTVM
jgi:hypothetical protein